MFNPLQWFKPRQIAPALKRSGLLPLLVLPLWACDPFHTGFEDVEPAQYYSALTKTQAPPPARGALKVMTWNVKFGGGRIDFFFDCYGDRVLMDSREVDTHMRGLAEKVRALDPDVILLQEVDVNSKRAAYIDQVQFLLDNTPMNYGVYASQWRADYVPSDGIGRIDSGNAILSKYPVKDAERIALPLISEQDGLTQYFYLRRNVLRARLDLGARDLPDTWVFNVHTAAFSNDGTKRLQINEFKRLMDEVAARGDLVIAGGDLNAIPPGSEKTKDFPDSVCTDEAFQADDYSAETTWLDALYRDYTPAVSLDEYAQDNAPHYTHTTDKDGFWARKLDYLFTNATWAQGTVVTHQLAYQGDGLPTMPLSDHAPITAQVILDVADPTDAQEPE